MKYGDPEFSLSVAKHGSQLLSDRAGYTLLMIVCDYSKLLSAVPVLIVIDH